MDFVLTFIIFLITFYRKLLGVFFFNPCHLKQDWVYQLPHHCSAAFIQQPSRIHIFILLLLEVLDDIILSSLLRTFGLTGNFSLKSFSSLASCFPTSFPSLLNLLFIFLFLSSNTYFQIHYSHPGFSAFLSRLGSISVMHSLALDCFADALYQGHSSRRSGAAR